MITNIIGGKNMYQQLKDEIREIIQIVNQCPEALQEKCFELLLKNYLKALEPETNQTRTPVPPIIQDNTTERTEPSCPSERSTQTGIVSEEINQKDFHVKIQRFLNQYGITYECINNLYYKENNAIKPLYESLKSTQMSECQNRLALLTAFEGSLATGDMQFSGETVRQRCRIMKCYDTANYASNFKNNAELFDNWEEKYDKNTTYVLSAEGKKTLARILLELAKEG